MRLRISRVSIFENYIARYVVRGTLNANKINSRTSLPLRARQKTATSVTSFSRVDVISNSLVKCIRAARPAENRSCNSVTMQVSHHRARA